MTRTHRLRWMTALAVAAAVSFFLGGARAAPALGEKYALLVGVHQYDKTELRDLPYAEADVDGLADVLRKAGYKRVVLMTQTEGAKQARFLPLAANVRKTLKGMLEDLTEGDSVLVAFAGHGVQYQGEDESYFCPMDAKLADKTTLVSLGEVYKELEKSAAGTRLLLADCCRNDPRSDEARAASRVKLESVTRPQKALPPGGVAAFFSCSAGEKAFESGDLKHGVFFHFIIEGLQGKADLNKDGQVDLDELTLYTRKQVVDFVKTTYGDDVRQMPEVVGKTRGLVSLARLDGGAQPDPSTTEKPDTTTKAEKLGKEYVNSLGMKLERIPEGKFVMGSSEKPVPSLVNDDMGPLHEVEFTHPFYMGAYTVTQEEYQNMTGKNPSCFSKEGEYKDRVAGLDTRRFPVENVTWGEAKAFCEALNKKDEKKPAGWEYGMPSEAEWEYACRAGSQTVFFFGDDWKKLEDYAWYINNSDRRTHEVGTRKPNAWGLYDMHGNVWQFIADGYKPYTKDPVKDPKIVEDVHHLLARGSWYENDVEGCWASHRNSGVDLEYRGADKGFRVVLRPVAKAP